MLPTNNNVTNNSGISIKLNNMNNMKRNSKIQDFKITNGDTYIIYIFLTKDLNRENKDSYIRTSFLLHSGLLIKFNMLTTGCCQYILRFNNFHILFPSYSIDILSVQEN